MDVKMCNMHFVQSVRLEKNSAMPCVLNMCRHNFFLKKKLKDFRQILLLEFFKCSANLYHIRFYIFYAHTDQNVRLKWVKARDGSKSHNVFSCLERGSLVKLLCVEEIHVLLQADMEKPQLKKNIEEEERKYTDSDIQQRESLLCYMALLRMHIVHCTVLKGIF